MGLELDKKNVQVPAGEGPLERFGAALITDLESDQAAFEAGKIGKIAWRERLALNDGEVDFDLVEPTGMDRRVDQDEIWPFGSQSSRGPLAAMGRAVVCDEEHAIRRTIRFLAHELGDKTLKRSDAVAAFAAAEQLGSMHIPSGEVGQCTGTCLFVLDVDRASRRGRQ